MHSEICDCTVTDTQLLCLTTIDGVNMVSFQEQDNNGQANVSEHVAFSTAIHRIGLAVTTLVGYNCN